MKSAQQFPVPERRGAASQRHGERGIAILMTLGVLSLMLILAMSFAYTARTERKAAGANADVVRARLLAESGVERALGMLRNMPNVLTTGEDAKYPGKHFYKYTANSDWRYLPCIGGVNTDTAALAEALQTEFGNETHSVVYIPDVSTLNTALEMNSMKPIGWQHVSDDGGDLIGRIGFLIVDDSGRIDPNSIVDPSLSEQSAAASRVGRYETEVQMGDIGLSDAALTTLLAESDTVRFFSQAHMVKTALSASVAAAESCLVSFMPLDRGSAEQYWDSVSSTAKNRYFIGDIGSPGQTPAVLQAAIPWLGKLEATRDINGDAAVDAVDTDLLRNQVWANLMDYVDSDDFATTDYSYNAGSPIATYAGVEKVPYINEIFFRLSTLLNGTELELHIDVRPELANIYPTDLPAVPWHLFVQTSFLVSQGAATIPLNNLQFSGSGAVGAVPANDYAANTYSYTYVLPDSTTPISSFDFVGPVYAVLSTATPITNTDNSNILDVAVIDKPPVPTAWPISEMRERAVWVDDPRSNTGGVGTNWQWEAAWELASVEETIGAKNAVTPNGATAGYDYEDVLNQNPAAGLSTAFVRNATMTGLWELGAIHRGEPWRTLNLTKHGTSGEYADGDARLLEEIKVDPASTRKGKINLNSPFQHVWQAVLGSITTGGDYDAPAAGTAMSSTENFNAASGVVAYIAAEPTVLVDRGKLAGVPQLLLGVTDKAREEVLAKAAHLLTANRNAFTVIVVAQAVKDLGTVPSAFTETQLADLVEYNTTAPGRWCQVLAEQKVLAVVHRDPFSNAIKIERFQYLYE